MIEYDEDWIIPLLFRKDGSCYLRAGFYAGPAALLAVLLVYLDEWVPGLREDLGIFDMSSSVVWSALTASLMTILSFRAKQGFSRFWEGTGLLHQMRGEWFDTVSNCVTFTIGAKEAKHEEVMNFRHSMVRLMSLAHGSALEEIAGNQIQLDMLDVYGLDDGTLNHLQECHNDYGFNKVEVMLHLLQSLIVTAHDKGILKIPPPILSRVFQTISRGFVNLLNAKKIADTRFPFPFTQLIVIMLMAHTIMTPLIMSVHVKSKILTAICSFLPVFGMFNLNFIASELENPFGLDDNDLPLSHFQEEMNSCLLMLLHPNTDLITGTSKRCIMDFYDLLENTQAEHDPDNGTPTRLSAFTSAGASAALPSKVGKQDTTEVALCETKVLPPDLTDSASPDMLTDVGEGLGAHAPKGPISDLPNLREGCASISIEAAGKVPFAVNDSRADLLGNLGNLHGRADFLGKMQEEEPILKLVELQRLELGAMLAASMIDFNVVVQRWTQMVEEQVNQLTQNSYALKVFGDNVSKTVLSSKELDLDESRVEKSPFNLDLDLDLDFAPSGDPLLASLMSNPDSGASTRESSGAAPIAILSPDALNGGSAANSQYALAAPPPSLPPSR